MRYLRLYFYFLRFSFSKAMEFRLDFFFRIFMDIFFYAIALLFFKVLYLHTNLLAGWTEEQSYIFVAGTLLSDAIMMTVFANNMWWFPVFVNRGDLDHYLTKPVSTLFFLSLRDFAANSFVNLIMAAGIFAWAIYRYSLPLSFLQVMFYLVLILNGAVLYYMFNMMFYFPVFWTGSPRGFGTLYWTMIHSAERPDRIYSGWVRRLFVYIIPFCLMVSYPTRLVLEEFDWNIFLHVVLLSLAYWPVYLFFWSRGLRAYSSASS